ncbi:MAG TPA: ribosome-associated translation inhibitor RaiA [Epulopiscium sp.]|nr:ribosome-associated translation inhibitor RaiA [Candidatus Epulonipiscium sp.]
MQYIISGKNIELTDALEDTMVKQMGKLDKYFLPSAEAQITFSVEKLRHIIEITIPFNGRILRAEVEGKDMYAIMDDAVAIIEKQLNKYKNKIQDKSRSTSHAIFAEEFMKPTKVEEPSLKIKKTKRFAIKPMSAEEAVLQMELVGHNFYVYLDENLEDVNVVYKRKNGSYGLIEPTLD